MLSAGLSGSRVPNPDILNIGRNPAVRPNPNGQTAPAGGQQDPQQASNQGAQQASGQGQGAQQASGQGQGAQQASGQGQGAQQASGQGAQQASGQGAQQASGQGAQQASGQGAQQAPGQGAQQASGQGAQQASGQGAQQASGQGAQQASGQGAQQASGQGAQQASNQGAQQAPNQGAQQASGQGTQTVQIPQSSQAAQLLQSLPTQIPGQTAQPAVTVPAGMGESLFGGMEPPLLETPSGGLLPVLEFQMQRLDGNFQQFLEKLADTPSFAEGMNKVLQEMTPAPSGELPEELEALVQQLPKDEAQLVQLVRQQTSGGTRFTGELFDLLRNAYAQTDSKTEKTEILQFVRRFNDYSSAAHIEQGMVRTLGQLAKASPPEYREELQAFQQQLGEKLETGDRQGALKLLQGKVLPFLREMSDRHPDTRLPNTLHSIFKSMASRYENSSEEGLLQAFRQLAEHKALKPHLAKLDGGDALRFLRESDAARAEENQRFAEQLAKTADWAMKGKGGGEPRKIFRQMISNLLLNKSVYLPLEHAVIPMEWNGKRLVSELWVDPDADRGPQAEDEAGRLIRFLLHMDIPGLGPFDLVLANQGEDVDLQLACPEAVVPFSRLIQGELGRILEGNGFKPSAIEVKKWEKPLTLAAVFPKIVRSENGVNFKA